MAGMEIPTLATERLVLRPFVEEDAAALFEISQDRHVMRFIGDRAIPSMEECWRGVAAWLGHWRLRGYGPLAIEERASGRFIGRVSLWYPHGWPAPELGYLLGRAWWGRGYATEAAGAALDWAFEHLEEPAAWVSLIDPANTASIRVVTKLGESAQGTTELRGHHLLVYGIDRVTWQAGRGSRTRRPG
jgi:RimJ/RimL family protein N-acetyltransferase